MQKKIIINGDLKDMVTYCSAIYKTEEEINLDLIKSIFSDSPIFEDKSFDIKVLGTLQKTSVFRRSKVFINKDIITLQIRYEIKRVTDIELDEEEENWIKNDVNRLLEHFESLINPFSENDSSD
ncbi:hypothetical protein ACFLS9_04600 [Bacteroidota bacterium]